MAPPDTIEVEAIVRPGGSIRIDGLPFEAGERVRVAVQIGAAVRAPLHSAEELAESRRIRESLRGFITQYDDPFGPAVPIEDWEVLRDDHP